MVDYPNAENLQHQLAIALLLIGVVSYWKQYFRCCHYALMCPPLVTVRSNNTGKLVQRAWNGFLTFGAKLPRDSCSRGFMREPGLADLVIYIQLRFSNLCFFKV